MEIILVSACLLGYNTKYNGGNNYNPLIEKIREKYDIIPICPEQLGGLKTPRVPSEIKGDEVYSKENKNVTSNFLEGSRKVANIALYNRIKKAITIFDFSNKRFEFKHRKSRWISPPTIFN